MLSEILQCVLIKWEFTKYVNFSLTYIEKSINNIHIRMTEGPRRDESVYCFKNNKLSVI